MPLRHISGHQHLLQRLAQVVARGTLPQSMIFSGPEGVGKHTAALALAQLLNCERPVPWPVDPDHRADSDDQPAVRDSCGECAACRRIARAVHADLLVVKPGESGTIKIDQIREAIDRSSYRPFEGRRRVVIIDDADALMPEVQNALLKTLEEPPPASTFVLVTARPDLLLPTVRSRCQQLRFGRLSPSDVAAALMSNHGFDAAAAHAAAAAADGSIGRALERDVEDATAARDAAARLLTSAAAGKDPRRRLDAAKALGAGAAERDALAERLRALSSLLRDLGAVNAEAPDRVLANLDLKPAIQSVRQSFDADRIDAAFAAVDRALAALDRNASPKIVADWVALNL